MNRLHHWYCNREAWKRHVREELVPTAIDGLDLGSDVLEIGPGFGPATQVLAERVHALTALEIDPVLATSLRDRLDGRVEIVDGDATAMPFADATFSGAACFTMLHHVPSPEAQNLLFAEVRRVLRPGAPFAGTDSTGRGVGFALLHIGDTRVVIDPNGLAQRLSSAGFEDPVVSAERDSFRSRLRDWRAPARVARSVPRASIVDLLLPQRSNSTLDAQGGEIEPVQTHPWLLQFRAGRYSTVQVSPE